MLLSVVIPTHNRADSLKECLEALTASITGHSGCEVLVIDDHSDAAVASVNEALCKIMHVGYRYLEKNRGAAIARNAGIEKATGDWVALLDDDVRVEKDWYGECRKAVSDCASSAVGIEGMVLATGDGVWDQEVENLRGGAYLTCHIVYRRDMLGRIGGFDGRFASRYPACEDHELAMRALLRGDIVFNPNLRAYHLPRAVHGAAHISDSVYRMKSLLDAEMYFFRKHRDRYHVVRHARTFWGTYKNIVLLHCLVSLRRRGAARLAAHPLQTMTLVAASIIEQLTALLLLPKYVVDFFLCEFLHHSAAPPPPPSAGGKGICPVFFREHIDEKRTRELWGMNREADISVLRCKPSLIRSLLFPVLRRPVYSMAPVLKRTKSETSLPDMRLLIRIDDVFMNEPQNVELLCEKMAQRRVPFCAGVTGNDLGSEGSSRLIERIRKIGGEIALHGFTHAGSFGPYASEMLQMHFPALDAALEKVLNKGTPMAAPGIFIPPYNAINRDQIAYLTRHFKVICGGPETARFTDCYTGPVALRNGAWYVPSFFPFYGAAAEVVSRMPRLLRQSRGLACITVHMPVEARDGFAALMSLIERLGEAVIPWSCFFSGHHFRNTPPKVASMIPAGSGEGNVPKDHPHNPKSRSRELV